MTPQYNEIFDVFEDSYGEFVDEMPAYRSDEPRDERDYEDPEDLYMTRGL